MNHELFSCPICGASVGEWRHASPDDPTFWLFEFRGLYRSPDGLILTGVGRRDGGPRGIYSAPENDKERWDDQGYAQGNEDDAFGILWQQPRNGKHGFVFHDACWSLLAAAYHPQPIPIQRVYDVCCSVPTVDTVLDWGHDYGGLIERFHPNGYPWDTREIQQRVVKQSADHNPFSVPRVQHILDQTPENPPQRDIELPQERLLQDPLSRLPPEISIAIATFLPTTDLLNCRLASAAFWPVFDSQSFWKSRFAPGNAERSWLFEARDSDARRDWRYLFKETASRLHRVPGLLDRKRIWNLIEKLMLLLDSYQGPEESLTPSWEESGHLWREAAAQMESSDSENSPTLDRQSYQGGSRALYHSAVVLPSDSFHFVFHFTTLGNTRFLSGIELFLDSRGKHDHFRGVSQSAAISLLGYRSTTSASHVFVSTPSEFRGFVLAVGLRGIQAIQVHSDQVSEWYGDGQQCPRTRRALAPSHAVAIKVAFDGFKIVSIGVAQACSPTNAEDDGAGRQGLQLYDQGIWFPDITPAHAHLNQASFPQLKLHAAGYHPLIWVSFGGPAGIYLQHLTGITMTVLENAIHGIEFHYNNSISTDTLGRHAYRWFAYEEYGDMQYFSIDGPGGERIESLSALLTYCASRDSMPHLRYGSLSRLTVITNRGRCQTFGSEAFGRLPFAPRQRMDRHAHEMTEKHLRPRNGSLITGLYAGWVGAPSIIVP